jgi:hypothetical protein
MTRTMWIALFCLMGLGPAIAIKVVTRPAPPAVEAAQDQGGTGLALAPNEAAKSDRLPLPDIRAGTEIMPVEPEFSGAVPAGPGTVKVPGRRWRDANARALADENLSNQEAKPPSRFNRNERGSRIAPSGQPHRHTMARPMESVGNSQPQRRQVWHCRQDAMGSVLRSLDLSPRCNM